MSTLDRLPYREIWAVDFEFGGGDGNVPVPRCLVARELRSGRIVRVWEDELLHMRQPPYPTDAGVLFVAYYASAEVGCHLAHGWPVPVRISTCSPNGAPRPTGSMSMPSAGGLVTRCSTRWRLWARHDAGRRKDGDAGSGDPRRAVGCRRAEALLDYCQRDVDALDQLIHYLLPLTLERQYGLAHALIRGRAMAALAHVEHNGCRSTCRYWSGCARLGAASSTI